MRSIKSEPDLPGLYEMRTSSRRVAIIRVVHMEASQMNPRQSDISQIKIGQRTYGIVGLKHALEALRETHAKQSDEAVAEELLGRLSNKNYIPDKVQEKYGRAFVREFRKYLGQALAEIGLAADLEHIRDAEAQRLVDLVDYAQGRVVSAAFAQNPSVSVTLFAFAKGEGVSTHTAPGDALLQVLDGHALVNIDAKEMTVAAGEAVVMPANVQNVTGLTLSLRRIVMMPHASSLPARIISFLYRTAMGTRYFTTTASSINTSYLYPEPKFLSAARTPSKEMTVSFSTTADEVTTRSCVFVDGSPVPS